MNNVTKISTGFLRVCSSIYAVNVRTSLSRISCAFQPLTQRRYKHYDPKFRKLRGKKFIKIELPNFDEMRKENNLSPDEMRSYMKEKGIVPPRAWIEKPIFISSTNSIFEQYIPPEGDGKASALSTSGAKQLIQRLEKKGKSYLALKKIKSFDNDFDLPDFAEKCQQIYIDAHNALANHDEDTLHLCVTEKCFPEMIFNTKSKTIRWKFLKSLEPPRVVHIRNTEMMSKENVFAQATVRLHTQQTLAVYDRFGRLMYGSEHMIKDVLEYVVFENHLANQYGSWRIHAKIIPDWMPPKDPIYKTYIKPKSPIVKEDLSSKKEEVVKSEPRENDLVTA